MLLLASFPQAAHAAGPVTLLLNGSPLSSDLPPVIEEGVTMVPVRAVLTPLGAEIFWDQATATVTAILNDVRIEASVGSATALVNGQPVPLSRPLENRDGRTFVPVRFFAENMGLAVDWDGATHTVLLYSRAEVPDRGTVGRTGAVVAANAAALIGTGYAWGGTSPDSGFDCSGFVYYQGQLVGMELPRTSWEQYLEGVPVGVEDLAAGDLVFFNTYGEGASHVGIYDGNGGFIHAQSSDVGVVRTSLWNPWWWERYLGARRLFR